MSAHAAEVADIVARQLGRHRIGLHDRLIEDLGAGSLDIVTIIAVLEESYGVSVDEERLPLLHTAADLASELARLTAGG
jgi:acyl carrier protein